MVMPVGNAVERPGSERRSCRTCSMQRMPSGHDKAAKRTWSAQFYDE